MASAAVGDELSSSICLNLYTELEPLRCGHNFCGDCIVTVLDTQEGSGVYSCPECRDEYVERPSMKKKRKLCNTVDNFRSTQQKEKSEILCTYCVDSMARAVKTCLHCETSMCDKHLTAHNKTGAHVLVEPTSSFKKSQCFIHKELLKYYCFQDAVCLCVSCCLVGNHKGHNVQLLEEALKKKTEKLRNVLEKLTTKRESTGKKILNLQDQKRRTQEKADDEKKRVAVLFEDIRIQLEVQEQRVLSEISRQVEEVSLSINDLIRQLEIQKDELSRKIGHFENLCNMTDPITVLQDQESVKGDQNFEKSSVCDLDDFLISLVMHGSITDLITNLQLKTIFNIQDATNLLLDEKTANQFVILSDDLGTASHSAIRKIRPKFPERFTLYNQVMSRKSFRHGRHYWEVEVGDCGNWDVGVCYPSIRRAGGVSGIGCNNKSWSFGITEKKYSCKHYSKLRELNPESPVKRLGLYLDYEGGRLSFYQLSDPIRHLHTFTTTFTEPLHAAFYLSKGAWVKLVSQAVSVRL
ncbi:E3 ubiquitin-protein ligase TRIM21-like isoform X4 [Rana temporaria]|uniref:E3 ubiquitin-protein ligase TRIM21-like isoform X4 n=1 Tax=Rana temporaria TaxID=8407 RepID=UPI001AADE4A9|nr:E3 ubiquitin-protein ligase TRIM21-like isoform X4 [Rana temporaria]